MCSGIVFLIGMTLLLGSWRARGEFRFNNREIPREKARIIGLILMAPLGIGMLYGFLIVSRNPVLTEESLINAACVEMGTLVLALAGAAYLVAQIPPSAPVMAGYGGMPAPLATPTVLTPAEAAAYLRVSEFEVIMLIEEGKLPAARIGGEYRIARIAVDDFLASQGGAPSGV